MTEQRCAVGTLILCSSTSRILLNYRAPYKTHACTWALWGGMIEDGESTKQALYRELEEEMGFLPKIERLYPFDIYESKDKKFKHYSFISVVDSEFVPNINKEASAYGWFDLGVWPKPLHPGLKSTFCKVYSEEKIRLIL